MALFVGDDWAEDHHDVEIQDETGQRLVKARLPEGVAGIARLHELIAQLDAEVVEGGPAQVLVGIETDRGPWVTALVAASYTVFAVNPRQVARYRERHAMSGAKSDAGDAHVLADMVRTDAHQLRARRRRQRAGRGHQARRARSSDLDLGTAAARDAAARGTA